MSPPPIVIHEQLVGVLLLYVLEAGKNFPARTLTEGKHTYGVERDISLWFSDLSNSP